MSTALRSLVFALGLVGASSASAAYDAAQSPTVLVKVRDVTQAPVPDAYVKLFPATAKAVPIGDGSFLFTAEAGSYDLFVESHGFREVAKRIEVRDGEPMVVNVELRVGSCPPGDCLTVSSCGREAVSIPAISITEEAFPPLRAVPKGRAELTEAAGGPVNTSREQSAGIILGFFVGRGAGEILRRWRLWRRRGQRNAQVCGRVRQYWFFRVSPREVDA